MNAQRNFLILFLFCHLLWGAGIVQAKQVKDKGWQIRQDILLRTVDPAGEKHWHKWRDQHSTLWFLHDWTVDDPNKPESEPLHLQVRIFMTPGCKLQKAGEQAVLKIFNKSLIIYSSDDHETETDSICSGKPLYITSLDHDRMAIISVGPGPYFGISVFTYKNGKVRAVLRTGSKLYPEIVYPTESGESERIITAGPWVTINGKEVPANACVYVWDTKSGSYKLGAEVPWSQRFQVHIGKLKPIGT